MTDQLTTTQPLTVTVAPEQTPTRCPEYWKLTGKLLDLDKDRDMEEHVNEAACREIQIKIKYHFRTCPDCKAWWAWITKDLPKDG